MSYYKIRPRSGTASEWNTANPILAEREIGFEYPAGGLAKGVVKMKMGDGTTHWNDLPYAIDDLSAAISAVDDRLTAESFTGTRDTTNTRLGNCYGTYDKATGIVTLIFHWASEGTKATGSTLFTIPEAYRPSDRKNGSAIIVLSGGTTTIGVAGVTASGLLSQGASNNATSGMGMIQYIL